MRIVILTISSAQKLPQVHDPLEPFRTADGADHEFRCRLTDALMGDSTRFANQSAQLDGNRHSTPDQTFLAHPGEGIGKQRT